MTAIFCDSKGCAVHARRILDDALHLFNAGHWKVLVASVESRLVA